jgi:type I restriction-modification system DNA methylase subunit
MMASLRGTGRQDVKSSELAEVRKTLWAAADQMRANSSLGPAEYRSPVLGLIFLAYAEHRFDQVSPELEENATSKYNPVTPDHYKAKSVLYIPEEARLSHLVQLPEGENLGKAVDDAMKAIEAANPELKDVLPRGYQRMEQSTLIELCRLFAPLPRQLSGDAFGLIYEDFLGPTSPWPRARLGGEFFTPHSIVRLIVEIIEPFQGRVFDPACGSGGMFVQCAKFVERHRRPASSELSVYGQEQKEVTVPLAKMNLALHGLSGDIRARQHLLRRPPQVGRPLRLRDGQSAVQRRRGRQGEARWTTSASRSASRTRQRQLPLDPDLLLRAQRRRAEPGSSWPTRPPTPGTPRRRSDASSSRTAPST